MIQGKRIRSLSRHLPSAKHGTPIVAGIQIDHIEDTTTLQRIGFSPDANEGETVLPSPEFGPVSRYNALGREIIHRDQPMETAYTQREWHWTEWHGDDPVDQSRIVDVPYQRYPRTLDPPPSLELTIAVTTTGVKILVAPSFVPGSDQDARVLHTINLFLEIFSCCELYYEDLSQIVKAPLQRLNWRLLPPGRHPWEELLPKLTEVTQSLTPTTRVVVEHRLREVNSYGPEFVAVGRAGFAGYVVFGFPDRALYVFESAYTGNATYIFGSDWQNLSRLTKAQILEGNLQKERIIHREGWANRLRRALAY